MRGLTEKEFIERYAGEYRVRGDEYEPKYCPLCHGGKNKDKYTFGLNYKKHTYQCLRGNCDIDRKGTFKQLCEKFGEVAEYYLEFLEKNGKTIEKVNPVKAEYTKPKDDLSVSNDEVIQYFLNRGISKEVATKYTFAKKFKNRTVCCFKFTLDGEHVMTKYRNIHYKEGSKEAKENQEAGGLSVLWNIDNIDFDMPVILTEGMIDALSVIEAGYENVVSVPSGCNNFKWIDNCWDKIQKVKEWILYTDNDTPGDKMKEELITKFGAEKCSVVNHDLKDANEELLFYGKEIVADFIKNASKVPLDGLVDVANVDMTDLNTMDRIYTGFEFLDKYLGGFIFPSLNVWTGKRGSGKSTVLCQSIIKPIEQNCNIFIYTGELDAGLFKLWLYNQIATSRHVLKNKDINSALTTFKPTDEAIGAIDKWIEKHVWLYDDKMTNKEDDLIEKMQQAYERYNCKLFILDNLTTIKFNPNRGGKYEAQSEFADRVRQFALKNKVSINLVVHPRKGDAKDFDNDTVGGSGDITNLAFSVINIRRIEDEIEDLTEAELKQADYFRLDSIDSMAEITKNRYFGVTGIKEFFTYTPEDKRISNKRTSNNIRVWENNLPNGYTDRLGKVYNNKSTKFEECEAEECPF